MTPVRYMSIHHTDVGIYSHVYQTYGIPLPNGVVYTYTPHTNTSHGRGVSLLCIYGGAGIYVKSHTPASSRGVLHITPVCSYVVWSRVRKDNNSTTLT